MPKQDNPLVRVREHSTRHLDGFGQTGIVPIVRVVEIAADLVPEGAEVVSEDTPLSEWTEAK